MEQKLSRREMIRGIAGLVLASPILTRLESKVAYAETPKKTLEDYGISMNEFYGVGLFSCTEILDKPELEGLECFKNINKGAKFLKRKAFEIPTYKKDEDFYLVVYNPKGDNPKGDNPKLTLNLSRIVELEGIKFIDGKPYEVKIRRGKIVEKKQFTSIVEKNVQDDDPFYEFFQRKLDILNPTEFEQVAKKGSFELNGMHRAFLVKKLSPGIYSSSLISYEGKEVRGTMADAEAYFKIIE